LTFLLVFEKTGTDMLCCINSLLDKLVWTCRSFGVVIGNGSGRPSTKSCVYKYENDKSDIYLL